MSGYGISLRELFCVVDISKIYLEVRGELQSYLQNTMIFATPLTNQLKMSTFIYNWLVHLIDRDLSYNQLQKLPRGVLSNTTRLKKL